MTAARIDRDVVSGTTTPLQNAGPSGCCPCAIPVRAGYWRVMVTPTQTMTLLILMDTPSLNDTLLIQINSIFNYTLLIQINSVFNYTLLTQIYSIFNHALLIQIYSVFMIPSSFRYIPFWIIPSKFRCIHCLLLYPPHWYNPSLNYTLLIQIYSVFNHTLIQIYSVFNYTLLISMYTPSSVAPSLFRCIYPEVKDDDLLFSDLNP